MVHSTQGWRWRDVKRMQINSGTDLVVVGRSYGTRKVVAKSTPLTVLLLVRSLSQNCTTELRIKIICPAGV